MKLCHVLKFIETSIFVEALGTHFGDPFFWPSESVRDGSEAVGPNLVDLLELSEHVRKQTHNVMASLSPSAKCIIQSCGRFWSFIPVKII